MMEGPERLYHERQRLQMCLLHSLNNLLQGESPFTKAELDTIADNLPNLEQTQFDRWNPFSPILKQHRNAITGNYDAEVLFAALKSRSKDVTWYDRRHGSAGLQLAGADHSLVGVVANILKTRLGGLWKGRHWVALCNVHDIWYNLDSDLRAPVPFKDGWEEVQVYMGKMLEEGAEIFLVRNLQASTSLHEVSDSNPA